MFESPWHWLIVAIVAAVLFFGWKQVPDMAKSVGKSLRIFKSELRGDSDQAGESGQPGGAQAPARSSDGPAAPLPPATAPRQLGSGASAAAPAPAAPVGTPAPGRQPAGTARPRPRPTPGRTPATTGATATGSTATVSTAQAAPRGTGDGLA